MANKTGLTLSMAPLPPDFAGGPQQLLEAFIARIRIEAPFGFTSFVISASEPTSNVGPWLKETGNGLAWFVWSDDEAKYIPLDITPSLPALFHIQDDEPDSLTPPLWFRTEGGDDFVEVLVALNGEWRPLTQASGTTAERPANPRDFQKFYDTDIECLIWWERAAWRTLSGVKGDVKPVVFQTAEDALLKNPGWSILGGPGTSTDNVNWRGRVLGQATKNPGGAATTDLAVASGITKRSAHDLFGDETHTLTNQEIPPHTHSVNGIILNQAGNDVGSGSSFDAGNKTTTQTGGGQPHNNIQPTLALWWLVKD